MEARYIRRRKPNASFFTLLGIIIFLLMVIFFLAVALPICGDVRGAIGLTAIPSAGLAATVLSYYRSCEYRILAYEQRKARALGNADPEPPAHAEEYFTNEDAEIEVA